jgi:hypothetical protein
MTIYILKSYSSNFVMARVCSVETYVHKVIPLISFVVGNTFGVSITWNSAYGVEYISFIFLSTITTENKKTCYIFCCNFLSVFLKCPLPECEAFSPSLTVTNVGGQKYWFVCFTLSSVSESRY